MIYNKLITINIFSNDLIWGTKIDSILQLQNLSAVKYTDFNSIGFEFFTESSIWKLEIWISLSFQRRKNFLGIEGICWVIVPMYLRTDAGFDEVML